NVQRHPCARDDLARPERQRLPVVLTRSAPMDELHDADCGCQEYQELSRRQFLTGAAGISAAAFFPDWLPKVVLAETYAGSRDVIVSIFQRGGADGLSMCVPFGDANYYASRSTIAVPR